MPKFKIEVTDARKKYPSKVYMVEAEQEFLAYGIATKQFIKDNGHRARGAAERLSTYYSRFYNKVVA